MSALPTPPAWSHNPGLEKGWASEAMGCGSLLASFSHLSDRDGNVGTVSGPGDPDVTGTGRGFARWCLQPASQPAGCGTLGALRGDLGRVTLR